jgi:hypothetical protein
MVMAEREYHPCTTDRWELIKYYWNHKYTWLWVVPGLVVGLIVGYLIHGSVTNPGQEDFWGNIAQHLIGIILTVTLLYAYEQQRDERRETRRLKRELPWEARSRSHAVAVAAIERMQDRNWLSGTERLLKGITLHDARWQDAGLQHADLSGADLQVSRLTGAKLQHADLSGTNLLSADLRTADLSHAKLLTARLGKAKLLKAILIEANLTNAQLPEANLELALLKQANLAGADLVDANLSGANLVEANLSGVKLKQEDGSKPARFSPQTILPDGKLWTPETDMAYFTSPGHNPFWRSRDPGSPAYSGPNPSGSGS